VHPRRAVRPAQEFGSFLPSLSGKKNLRRLSTIKRRQNGYQMCVRKNHAHTNPTNEKTIPEILYHKTDECSIRITFVSFDLPSPSSQYWSAAARTGEIIINSPKNMGAITTTVNQIEGQ